MVGLSEALAQSTVSSVTVSLAGAAEVSGGGDPALELEDGSGVLLLEDGSRLLLE